MMSETTLNLYASSLEAMPQAMPLDSVDGFLTAISIGPSSQSVDAHYAALIGSATPSAELRGWIEDHLREIRVDLKNTRLRDPILLHDEESMSEEDPDDSVSLGRWLLGFSEGMSAQQQAWESAFDDDSFAKIAAPLTVLLGELPALAGEEASELSDDQFIDCVEDLPLVLGEIDRYFRTRELSEKASALSPRKR